MDNFIPFSKPTITGEDIEAVTKVMLSGWLTVGPRVKEFEEKVVEYTGIKRAVATDSCTSALTLSLTALRKKIAKPRAVALVPALTFVATANAAFHAGFDVEFCDVDMDGNLDFSKAPKNINYDVIIPVHFAGQFCNLDPLFDTNSFIIEDAAHAFGCKELATQTHGACFSFYPTKNLTTVEGGIFLTKYDDLADKVKSLSLHGLDSSHVSRYERSSLAKPAVTDYPGFKANMTDVEAALGISQLSRIDEFLSARKALASIYMQELGGHTRWLDITGNTHVWHMFVILVENRDYVIQELKSRGIGAGIHYNPIIPFHPFYKNLNKYEEGDFPVAEYISNHCISLPFYPSIKDEELDRVIKAVKEIV